MKLRSHIALPGFAFQKYNARQKLTATVTAAAVYEIVDGSTLRLAQQQPEIRLSDDYDRPGEADACLMRVADFVAFRPTTDITLLAAAHSPNGRPATDWTVGVSVGPLSRMYRVHGPRMWHPVGRSWRMGAAEPVETVPMDWHLAHGGKVYTSPGHDRAQDVHPDNPVGSGLLVDGVTPTGQPFPAPRIEEASAPVEDPFAEYVPQGTAPIAPVWRFRQRHAGTYDEAWKKVQHPFPPRDFDPAFHQVAHPDLQSPSYLRGDEPVVLDNLHAAHPRIAFALPGVALGAVATHDGGQTVRLLMDLDGVHFDLLDEAPSLRLTWRAAFEWHDGISTIDMGPLDFASAYPEQAA